MLSAYNIVYLEFFVPLLRRSSDARAVLGMRYSIMASTCCLVCVDYGIGRSVKIRLGIDGQTRGQGARRPLPRAPGVMPFNKKKGGPRATLLMSYEIRLIKADFVSSPRCT